MALVVCAGAIAGQASSLLAQELTPEERATGEKLYQRGVELMHDERYDEACPLLEQGVTIVHRQGVGGLLALAECRERQGKTATAWGLYREVASKARMAGQPDRLRLAEQATVRLEAKLHQIEIGGGAELAAIEGLVVEVQGHVVASTILASVIVVDPGPWKIVVRAPDGRSGTASLSVPDTRGTTALALELRAAAAPVPAATGLRPLTLAGIVVTSIGAAAMVSGGTIFGVARRTYPRECKDANGDFEIKLCDDSAAAARDDANEARTLGDVGGALFWAGLGVAATGVVLLLIPSPDTASSSARWSPWIGPEQAGVTVTLAL